MEVQRPRYLKGERCMKRNPFERGAKEYDAWFDKNAKIFKSELKAVEACLEKGKKTIEIGVGTGIFARALGIHQGVEPSDDMARLAKDRGIDIIKGYAEHLPISDNTYEQVLMITVDCFLDDIEMAFSEVKRILIRGGSFIIATINKDTELGQIYDNNKSSDEIYKWADFRSTKEIIAILEHSGFQILKTYQTITGFDNRLYEVKEGYGEGVFTVIKASS